jgi:hypothetical protein
MEQTLQASLKTPSVLRNIPIKLRLQEYYHTTTCPFREMTSLLPSSGDQL